MVARAELSCYHSVMNVTFFQAIISERRDYFVKSQSENITPFKSKLALNCLRAQTAIL